MGETDLHRNEIARQIAILTRYYQGQRVYVSGDLLVFYELGNPKKYVVPDVFVVKGAKPYARRNYLIWAEGRPPTVIVEVTSRTTKKNDLVDKPALYRRIGVSEYFLFDPTHDYLSPPLQGFRLNGAVYEAIPSEAEDSLTSRELGLRLVPNGAELDFYRLATGERLLSDAEAFEQADEARIQADEARIQADEARMQADEARIQADEARMQADEARIQAEARAAEEAAARAAAEAEIARLREELARRKAGP